MNVQFVDVDGGDADSDSAEIDSVVQEKSGNTDAPKSPLRKWFWELVICVALLLSIFSVYSTTYILDNVCVVLRNPKNASESAVMAYRLNTGGTTGYSANYKSSNASLRLSEIRAYRWQAPMEHRLEATFCTNCYETEARYCNKRGLPVHCGQLGADLEPTKFATEMLTNTLLYRFKFRFNNGEEWWSDGPGYNCPHFIYAVDYYLRGTDL